MQETRVESSVVLARPAQSARNVVKFGFRPKNDAGFATSPCNTHAHNDVELDIRVHVDVERSVVVDYTDDTEHLNSYDKVAR
jgi:hypothetical protein